MEQASNAGAGQDQVEPCGQERRQQTNRPAGLDMTRTGWGLARLGVHDWSGQRVLGRPSAAGLILQSGYALLLIAVQPGAHDILPTGMNHRNPGDSETSVGEQDHLSAQGHAPDRLMAQARQFLPLRLRQGHVDHLSFLRLSEVAELVPHI